jgi:hypothetical protein
LLIYITAIFFGFIFMTENKKALLIKDKIPFNEIKKISKPIAFSLFVLGLGLSGLYITNHTVSAAETEVMCPDSIDGYCYPSSPSYWSKYGNNLYPNSSLWNVGIGTSSPTAKLQVSEGSVLFNGATGTTPASGAGTRMMWIPSKSAFRVGSVTGTNWDDANIGSNSIVLGKDGKASGNGSIVIGSGTSTGNATITIGTGNASGPSGAIALGGSTSSGVYTTSMGHLTNASGGYSLAGGYATQTTGLASVALGRETIANGTTSFALGNNVNTNADYAFALGTGYYDGFSWTPMSNNTKNSLAVGFNSNLSTLFVGPANGLNTTGNVGIGTATPAEKLEVNGSVMIKNPSGRIQLPNVAPANQTPCNASTAGSMIYQKIAGVDGGLLLCNEKASGTFEWVKVNLNSTSTIIKSGYSTY